MGNSLIFPAPKNKSVPRYMEDELKFFEKPKSDVTMMKFSIGCYGERKKARQIPYLHFCNHLKSNKNKHLIIYFQGNSEILSQTYWTLNKYYKILEFDVVAPEYPGYGLYSNEEPSERTILDDAATIIQHCIQNLKYSEENIILIGRSLGTGVAIQMACAYRRIKAIILISAYLSIRYVGEKIAGKTLSRFLPNVFRNEDFIELIKTPILFIHGMRDTMIPWTASETLYIKCKATKELHLAPKMDHNNINFKEDVMLPTMKFLKEKLGMEDLNFNEGPDAVKKLEMLNERDSFPYLVLPFLLPSLGVKAEEDVNEGERLETQESAQPDSGLNKESVLGNVGENKLDDI